MQQNLSNTATTYVDKNDSEQVDAFCILHDNGYITLYFQLTSINGYL